MKLLQPRLGSLAIREIANESREVSLIGGSHFAHRQFHRKGRAIPAFADDDPADADDAPFPGLHVAPEIAVMVFAVRRGDQDSDALAQGLSGPVTGAPVGR